MSPEVLIGKILVLLALAVALIYFGLKLKMPAIIGFLATGLAVGPQGLDLLGNDQRVEALSELGVVLLLFTIGLEFSISNLMRIKRTALLGGSLQILLTVLLALPPALMLGLAWNTAVMFGLLFALSSTAIVLKLFQDRGEMDSLHGRASVGVLIFQDLAVVPLVLILPLLAGQKGGQPIYLVLAKAAVLLAVILTLSHKLVPWLLERIAATKSHELFLFTVGLICLGTAFATAEAGLSLALGAFVAGLVISGSPYSYQAISSVMPMRDIFTSLFFISIGLRMDLHHLFQHPLPTIGLALGLMFLNVIAAALAMRLAGLNWRVALLTGFALSQVGEFSFVLAKDGQAMSLLSADQMTMFLNAAVLTMAMTPLALALGDRVTAGLKGDDRFEDADEDEARKRRGHVLVVGFGVAGQGVARACKTVKQPYLIIDLNPANVRQFRQQGEPIIYGDAVNEEVLIHAGLKLARVLVLSIPDPLATRRIVSLARSLSPDLHIMARTRFLMSKPALMALGADEVLTEEYEAGLSIFNSLLAFYEVPEDERNSLVLTALKAGPDNFHLPPK